ncbi:serine/threonine-protein kinase [Streptomyces goshikiensis]|uniref:serine/threonine-protein kinase n=1 Tax=Streptomyces goshikiensis TaxID=1942 RepID=UPI0033E3C82E
MSKPEHTESPEPSVGAGSPAAKPGPAPTAPGPADPSTPASAAGDPDPAKPAAAKPAAKGPDPAKPKAAKPAAKGSDSAKPAAGKSSAAADASAEPEDAKPAGAAKPAAAPEAAKPVVKGPDLAKPAPGKSSAEADASAEAEAGDAKPAASKGAGKAASGGLDLAKSSAGKPSASAEAGDAKPAASKGAGKAAPATPAAPVKGKASNPVTEKADAVAAEVKARAEAAKAAGNGQDKGRLLAGRYRLGAVLGKGGMGTVWRAEDETLGRTVAVKELRFSTGVDEDEKRRLITRTLREAKAIARIRSGGAVTVYDVVDEDGRPWIVMELIEGPSLAEFIRERGTLTPRRAAEVGLAVLDVLRAAHGQGILHRDVKPSNVLIAGNGRVILTDFGIAQVEGDPSVTSTGMLVGAPSYISPERARGQRPGPPADMWSLGGLLYAAVEGVPPYDKGSALATLTAVMTEPVDPPKNAGPLTEVIYGLLVKDPARRLDDERARAMLTAVINAPDEPEPAPEPVPSAEETRQISLVEAKQAAEKIAEAKAEKKERERREREQRERARAVLKATRKAAGVPAASAAAAPAARPRGPIAASLTDVMPRRTIALAIAGVIVVLAVIGSLVVYAFSGDDKGGKNEGKAGATPSASGSASTGAAAGGTAKGGDAKASADPKGGGEASPGQSPGNQQSSQGQTQGQSQGQTQGQGEGGDSQGQGAAPGTPGGTLPAGYATVTDPRFHFSMAMPEGFHQTDTAGENSGAIYSRDGGFPRIQVDFNGSPLDDARAAWASLAPAVAGSSKNYKVLRIESVKYRDYPTVADWEFERDQKGIRVRVLNRGFKADAKHGFAIMISCPAADWDGAECTQMRTTAFETFQILG